MRPSFEMANRAARIDAGEAVPDRWILGEAGQSLVRPGLTTQSRLLEYFSGLSQAGQRRPRKDGTDPESMAAQRGVVCELRPHQRRETA